MSPVALAMLPSLEHREIGVGPYAIESLAAPGLEVMTRHVDSAGNQMNLRMQRDDDGTVQLDRFELESVLLTVRVRPELGDAAYVGLALGSWDQVWRSHNGSRVQARLYSPMTLSGLGWSRTVDDPEVFRYTAAAGTGVGGEVLIKVLGPLGVQLRGDVQATAQRRAGGDNHYTTRQEVAATGEVGLAVLAKQQVYVLGAWAEAVTQWEPWDAGGRNGVDREYFAAGARLSGRFYDPPGLDLPDDLEELQDWDEFEVDLDRNWEAPPEDVPVEASDSPLEVHWSEVTVTREEPVAWPEGAIATCSVVFEIDGEGNPTDVRPDSCPSDVLPAVMEAAWAFSFKPMTEGGNPVPARFLYTFTPSELEPEAEKEVEVELEAETEVEDVEAETLP
jgi:hypothetical protein